MANLGGPIRSIESTRGLCVAIAAMALLSTASLLPGCRSQWDDRDASYWCTATNAVHVEPCIVNATDTQIWVMYLEPGNICPDGQVTNESLTSLTLSPGAGFSPGRTLVERSVASRNPHGFIRVTRATTQDFVPFTISPQCERITATLQGDLLTVQCSPPATPPGESGD